MVLDAVARMATEYRLGQAVRYPEHALPLGVPASASVLEPRAANTGQNLAYSRQVLASLSSAPASASASAPGSPGG
ncbi:hypothetical protein ACFZC3_23865 [Streptomyces sp. NPDC007903]|uniref:hypothetical protein n=1 Tax=Streptomyces sp. NPDC007903 TaxID=3364786 RepID=UPI0036EDA327